MFQRFASIAQTFGRRAERRARGGRAEGWGKSCVCVCVLLGKRTCLGPSQRDTRANSKPLVSTGKVFPQVACVWLGTWRTCTKEFSGEREKTTTVTRYMYDRDVIHGSISEANNAPSHFTIRHIKHLTAQGRNATDDPPGADE